MGVTLGLPTRERTFPGSIWTDKAKDFALVYASADPIKRGKNPMFNFPFQQTDRVLLEGP